MFELHQGDCLEVMKQIPNASVDMVLCDLPYGTTACTWDSVLPLDLLWQEYKRLQNNRGNFVFTASQPFTTSLICSNKQWFRYEMIWEKPQGTNPFQAKYAPLKNHENVLVFYENRKTYNPQMSEGKPYSGFKSKDDKRIGEVYGKAKSTHRNNPTGERYPKSVVNFSQEKGLHPTQKPVALLEYLIKTYTNPGDVVLDNTMGSGSTGVACANTGRRFIGIEKDEKYFQIAKKRVEEAYANSIF